MEGTALIPRASRATTEVAESNVIALKEKQGINISGDTVIINTAEFPEEQRALLRWLFFFAKDQEWTWDQLELNVKISSTTLYRVWHDKYRDKGGDRVGLDSLCEKLARFKKLAEERALANKLPFIETSVFKRIDKICREALIMQSIALIYGESQIGKTESLNEHTRRNNHGQTIYVLMPASAGVQAMMKAIARACNISADTSFESLRERVANALDDSRLLIIDEVHECFVSYQKTSMVKCLSVLRQLQEQTQCGLVLCGTNVFRHELERGEFAQSLKQLRKRGIWELQLEDHPTKEDLALIARHYKLSKPEGDAADLVTSIAKEMGLGKYVRFMARAAKSASEKGQRVTWDHFVNVIQIAAKMKEQPIN